MVRMYVRTILTVIGTGHMVVCCCSTVTVGMTLMIVAGISVSAPSERVKGYNDKK